jgi:hypothetical protein
LPILKGRTVDRVRALFGKDPEMLLQENEEVLGDIQLFANKLGVHLQTVYKWRHKLGFRKRRRVKK